MIVFIYNSLGKKRRKGRNIHRVSYFIITLGFTIVGFYFSLMIKIHEIYKFYYIFLYTYHCWNLICSLKCVWRPPEFDFYNNSGLFISHLCIIVLIKSRASFLLNRKDSFFFYTPQTWTQKRSIWLRLNETHFNVTTNKIIIIVVTLNW